MTQDTPKHNCWCCSGKPADQCCYPLLKGYKNAKTPLALMRSRYSAYVLGGYGDYLVKTWLPAARVGLNSHELSIRTTNWVKLEIVSKTQSNNQGTVEFKATYLDAEQREHIYQENSSFCRIDGRWYYS